MIIFNNFSKVERVMMIIKVFAQVERVTRETEGNSLTALVTSPDGELQVLIMSKKMTNRIFICCNTPISFPLTLLSRVKRWRSRDSYSALRGEWEDIWVLQQIKSLLVIFSGHPVFEFISIFSGCWCNQLRTCCCVEIDWKNVDIYCSDFDVDGDGDIGGIVDVVVQFVDWD